MAQAISEGFVIVIQDESICHYQLAGLTIAN